ncbi:sensor histidine kinase [Tahibacter amnicola]|uniref:histidine kinase n=1 Tax=Tahibacter amnicola TaxID=2976241 RepID=A0ABY6BGF8_9GAMM|nr:ATP-binding protein [Tahibacter amnicola]UXI68844.1 ATP-binding protein [Tahibacter amnicola]
MAVLLGAAAAALGWRWKQSEADKARLLAEHQQVEAELKQLQSSQAQVIHTTKLASLGQMVAGVAHELNTPLGFVKSNVEVVCDLLDDYRKLVKAYDAAVQYCQQPVDLMFGADKSSLDKLVKHVEESRRKLFEARTNVEKSPLLTEAKELLADAGDGITQLASLVQNLKGFARVDRDGMDLMDVNEGVESALMIAAHQLRDRIKVVRRFDQVPRVRGMPSQLNQVFLNLITNAAQAMEDEGTLTVTTRAGEGQVEILFADTGCGIPDDVLPKIFDPFFTTKAPGEGTGLGLSIVHKIVKSHGGSIKVRTTPNRGSEFTVMLPSENPAGGRAATLH